VLADVDGGTLSLPIMPGEAIKAVIRELGLPRVSAIAWNVALESPAPNDESEYPAPYGIECNYRNAKVRVCVIDNGTSVGAPGLGKVPDPVCRPARQHGQSVSSTARDWLRRGAAQPAIA
jgi:hypothetical protein